MPHKNPMTKKEFDAFNQTYRFDYYADIKESKDKTHADYSDLPDWEKTGWVYLWVEEDNSEVKVVYVGKAGKTMRDRCKDHVGGFKGGSKTGKKHSDNILAGIATKKHYCVYARKSGAILDDEEQAFIQKLNPPWNTKKGKKKA